MPRVYGITLPAGLEIIYNKTLKMYDIRIHCNIGKNRRFVSRATKYRLRDFTKLYLVAYAWAALSQAQKDAWYTAGDAIGVNGYSLWTQDKIYRLMNNIAGNATPNIYHQYKIGRLNIDVPSDKATVVEYHVTAISLPATYEISYKSDLTSVGPDPKAEYVLKTLRYSGGQNIVEEQVITIPLSQSWEKQTDIVVAKEGIMGEWSVEIRLQDVTGELLFDNTIVTFDGETKTWDPFCNDVSQYWIPVDVSGDVTFESIYPT